MTVGYERLNDTTENPNAGTVTITEGSSGLRLYEHQRDALSRMNKAINNTDNYSGLLVLPTGGGKTLTATYWLMGNVIDKGTKVIWLAHRHELLNQARQGFEKVSYGDIAKRTKDYSFRVISGQHDKPVHIQPHDDVLIASKTSLRRGFSHLKENWLSEGQEVFLVIDEAHHATAKEYREVIRELKNAVPDLKILGLTATPFRTAGNEQGLLNKVFPDNYAFEISLRELINRGVLAEPIFEEVTTEVDMIRLFKTKDGKKALERIEKEAFFDIGSIGENLAKVIAENAERNNLIVKKYVDNKEKYGKTLVFALNIPMALALNGVFQAHGVKSDYIVSDIKDMVTGVTTSSKENAEKIQRFRDEDKDSLDVLINVNILTEGTDLPKVQSVFLTRPTKSTILMTQMIGRALRGEKAGGTKESYIVSFVDDWHQRIAWVNPEQLYIDENAVFDEKSKDSCRMVMRLVAISKIEEFAAIANNMLDKRLQCMSFIERIPVGMYHFSYLVPREDEEDEEVYCDILVYDCMKTAYGELFEWLKDSDADLNDMEEVVRHVHDTIFTETGRLLGYRIKDVEDIVTYFRQTDGDLPEFIPLSDRENYDVSKLAQHIIDKDLGPKSEQEFINNEWETSESRWRVFYGVKDFTAFRMTIRMEKDKILYPEAYKPSPVGPVTISEQRLIQDLPLYEIRQKFPPLGEKIRNAVFEKYTDEGGNYYCANSKIKSKRKLDFHIDHVIPMSKGGKTVLENLQLLTRKENMVKSDKAAPT